MKTAQQAAAAYVANGTTPTAAQLWSTDYVAALPTMLDKAIAAIPLWQQNVSTALAASNMNKGLTRAKGKTSQITTKVTGPGQASFTAGVRAAGSATGNYTAFIGPWMSAVSNEVSVLNASNPRGTRAQNRARQAAYDQWVDTQAGNFRIV